MSLDKFGNEQRILGMRRKVRPNGSESFPRNILRVGNQAFKVELASSNKEGVSAWLVVTKLRQNGGGGGGNGYSSGGGRSYGNNFQGPMRPNDRRSGF